MVEIIALQLFGQLLYLSLHDFDRGFGAFVVGDDHFGEFGQGFFKHCGVVPQIMSLLWFVVSYLVVVSMNVLEILLLEVIVWSLLSSHVVNLLSWYLGTF